jgi:hypothetical protein
LLGEAMTLTQAIGGVVVLVGLTLAWQGDRTDELAELTVGGRSPEGLPSPQSVGRG